jgi:hypothetical protein
MYMSLEIFAVISNRLCCTWLLLPQLILNLQWILIQGAAFNVTHFELAILLVWVVGGVADNSGWVQCGLGFSEQWNVCAAAHILCGTVRVKQVDRIRAARVSSEIW